MRMFKEFKNVLTLKEAQVRLHVSTTKINQLVHQKGFPSFKVGRLWRVDEEKLRLWITKQIQDKDDACIS